MERLVYFENPLLSIGPEISTQLNYTNFLGGGYFLAVRVIFFIFVFTYTEFEQMKGEDNLEKF